MEIPKWISSSGKPFRFRCSACGHAQMMDLGVQGPQEEPVAALPVEPALSPGVAGSLYIKREGTVYLVKDWANLQRWIIEGRLSPTDLVSEDGVQWQPLGDRPELGTFFLAVEKLEHTARQLRKALDGGAGMGGETPFSSDPEGELSGALIDDDTGGIPTGLPPLPTEELGLDEGDAQPLAPPVEHPWSLGEDRDYVPPPALPDDDVASYMGAEDELPEFPPDWAEIDEASLPEFPSGFGEAQRDGGPVGASEDDFPAGFGAEPADDFPAGFGEAPADDFPAGFGEAPADDFPAGFGEAPADDFPAGFGAEPADDFPAGFGEEPADDFPAGFGEEPADDFPAGFGAEPADDFPAGFGAEPADDFPAGFGDPGAAPEEDDFPAGFGEPAAGSGEPPVDDFPAGFGAEPEDDFPAGFGAPAPDGEPAPADDGDLDFPPLSEGPPAFGAGAQTVSPADPPSEAHPSKPLYFGHEGDDADLGDFGGDMSEDEVFKPAGGFPRWAMGAVGGVVALVLALIGGAVWVDMNRAPVVPQVGSPLADVLQPREVAEAMTPDAPPPVAEAPAQPEEAPAASEEVAVAEAPAPRPEAPRPVPVTVPAPREELAAARPAPAEPTAARTRPVETARPADPPAAPPAAPPSPSAGELVEQGWAAVDAGNLSGAGRAFQSALAKSPNDTGALLGRGFVLAEQGKHVDAKPFLCKVLSLGTNAGDKNEAKGILDGAGLTCP
ncbi:MAG: hypothetical protein JXX28_00285 [Deltaproteobacteria bacterium]|nr:hypothetical protein [Deltaproteobacteria bacterium]